jgi:hypothetical protein
MSAILDISRRLRRRRAGVRTHRHGRVARVIGPVIDVEFPTDAMPEIYNALKVDVTIGEEATHTLTARGGAAHRRRPGAVHLHAADRRPDAWRNRHQHR